MVAGPTSRRDSSYFLKKEPCDQSNLQVVPRISYESSSQQFTSFKDAVLASIQHPLTTNVEHNLVPRSSILLQKKRSSTEHHRKDAEDTDNLGALLNDFLLKQQNGHTSFEILTRISLIL